MPLYNERRKLCQLLFYHRFAHQHQIIHIALLNLCIQLCNIGYTNQPAPGFKLLKHMKQLCLILKSVSCRQPDTRCIKTNGKMCEIGGIRQHDAVKIIIISAQCINTAGRTFPACQKICLVFHSQTVKIGLCLCCGHNTSVNHLVCGNELLHPLFNFTYILRLAVSFLIDFAILTATEGMLHADTGIGKQTAHRYNKQKIQAALIDKLPGFTIRINIIQCTAFFDSIIQIMQLSIQRNCINRLLYVPCFQQLMNIGTCFTLLHLTAFQLQLQHNQPSFFISICQTALLHTAVVYIPLHYTRFPVKTKEKGTRRIDMLQRKHF